MTRRTEQVGMVATGAIRARLWKRAGCWNYQVLVGRRVVFADNVIDYTRAMQAARKDVVVARRVISSGHGFTKTWPDLVGAVS